MTRRPPQSTFSEGDRVCFKIRVQFPTDVATRNPDVRDFLPPGLNYEPGSAVATTATPSSSPSTSRRRNPLFVIGNPRAGVAVRPQGRGLRGGALRRSSARPGRRTGARPHREPGEVHLRHLHRHRLAARLGGRPHRRAAADLDRQGRRERQRRPGQPARHRQRPGPCRRRRHLPGRPPQRRHRRRTATPSTCCRPTCGTCCRSGITCADISAISDGGACTDPGDPAQPTFSGNGTHSAIRWQLPASPALAPGATRTLTYAMTIPADTSVNTSFPNTAAVRSYDTATNRPGVTAEHLPRSNIDTSTDPRVWDVPRASDDLRGAHARASALAKTNLTDITEQNNGLNQAVVGETLTYTLQLRVPAHTSVFNGVLTDPMPDGHHLPVVERDVLGDQHLSRHRPAAGRVHPRPGQRHPALPGELHQQRRHPPPVRGADPGPGQHPRQQCPRRAADQHRALQQPVGGRRSAPTCPR